MELFKDFITQLFGEKKKINILVYGNCQSVNIAKILNKISSELFETKLLKPVYMIDDLKYFDEIRNDIAKADYIITQSIFSDLKTPFKRVFPFMKKNAKIIIFDSLYNTMYHPELVKTSKLAPVVATMLHDKNIIKAVRDDIPLESFLENDPFNKDSFYQKEEYENCYKQTIVELKKRQKKLKKFISMNNLDNVVSHIDITPLIDQIYLSKDTKSSYWGDHNHPNLPVFMYLLKEIMKIIDSSYWVDETKYIESDNNLVIMNKPLYLSAINHYNTEDKNRMYTFKDSDLMEDTVISRDIYVKRAYEIYSKVEKDILYDVIKENS